jgi:hypothetical protein
MGGCHAEVIESLPSASSPPPLVVMCAQDTKDPINIAYSNAGLDLHMDLAYLESPPGLQLLHCLQFDEDIQGGLSQLLDGFRVAEVGQLLVTGDGECGVCHVWLLVCVCFRLTSSKL